MELYWYSSGKRRKTLETGSELGSGKEGSVFEVLGEPGTVVKVFKADRGKTPAEARREAEERAKKLELFVRHPPPNPPDPDDGHRRFAWPERVLFDGAGLCAGYAMPRVASGKPLGAFIYPNPKDGLLAELKLRVAIAREVASIVAEVHLHELSMRLGDISPANFLADAKGKVTFIDIESAEITSPDDGHVYLCPTRTSEYTAPELIGRDLSKTRRTEEQDLFGLAVLEHRLLFEGWHPFAASDQEAIETHILGWVCPLIRGGAGRPPEAPPFGGGPDFDVGDELRALFVRAFVDGHGEPRLRPKAAEWNRPLLCYEKVLRRRARRVSLRPVPRAARPRRRAVAVMGFFVGAAAIAASVGFFYAGRLMNDADVKWRVSAASDWKAHNPEVARMVSEFWPWSGCRRNRDATYAECLAQATTPFSWEELREAIEELRRAGYELGKLYEDWPSEESLRLLIPAVTDTELLHQYTEKLIRDDERLIASTEKVQAASDRVLVLLRRAPVEHNHEILYPRFRPEVAQGEALENVSWVLDAVCSEEKRAEVIRIYHQFVELAMTNFPDKLHYEVQNRVKCVRMMYRRCRTGEASSSDLHQFLQEILKKYVHWGYPLQEWQVDMFGRPLIDARHRVKLLNDGYSDGDGCARRVRPGA